MSTTKDEIAPFGVRLGLIMRQFGSVAELARAIGVSDNAIYKWIAGRGQPSLGSLVAIAAAAGVSVEWLATGRESPPPSRAAAAPAASRPAGHIYPPRGELKVVGTRGGIIRNPQIVDWLAFRLEWLEGITQKGAGDQVMLLQAAGDAMAPTINDGDLLIVDLTQTRLRQDGIHVLRDGTDLMVRRLYRQRGGAVVTVRGDNPAYEQASVAAAKLRIVGRVVWSGGRK